MSFQLRPPLYIIAFFLFIICVAHACTVCAAHGPHEDNALTFVKVPLPRRKFVHRLGHHLNKNSVAQAKEVGPSTLSPQIQNVISQLQNSKIMKVKANYKELLNQLNKIFHTTSSTVCARCKRN